MLFRSANNPAEVVVANPVAVAVNPAASNLVAAFLAVSLVVCLAEVNLVAAVVNLAVVNLANLASKPANLAVNQLPLLADKTTPQASAVATALVATAAPTALAVPILPRPTSLRPARCSTAGTNSAANALFNMRALVTSMPSTRTLEAAMMSVSGKSTPKTGQAATVALLLAV